MIDETRMTLAVDWKTTDVTGWFFSEKIWDCRAYWQDGEFWTRGGNLIKAPKWFRRGMPKADVDGGIYAGRRGFQTASNAVRLGGHWFDDGAIQFIPFDFPQMTGTWDKRITEANRALRGSAAGGALKFWRVREYKDWIDYMLKIRPLGGEGVCFRNPEIKTYETGRSETLLRFKFLN